MGRRSRRRATRRKDWGPVRWLGGVALVFGVPPVWFVLIPIISGQQPYDGVSMFGVLFFLGAAAALISWLPHMYVIDDGHLPTFTHERNTPILFWYLVVMTLVCAMLFGLAPFWPLADGYDLTVGVLRYRHGILPLWLVAPPLWAASGVMLYRTGRAMWRRVQRSR